MTSVQRSRRQQQMARIFIRQRFGSQHFAEWFTRSDFSRVNRLG
jgi:hypothetical protein